MQQTCIIISLEGERASVGTEANVSLDLTTFFFLRSACLESLASRLTRCIGTKRPNFGWQEK